MSIICKSGRRFLIEVLCELLRKRLHNGTRIKSSGGTEGATTQMPEIKTKSLFYDLVDRKDDGFRVLIMRYWPRPLTKKQVAAKRSFTDLVPSRELQRLENQRGNRMDWSDFIKRILEEFANNPLAQLYIEC